MDYLIVARILIVLLMILSAIMIFTGNSLVVAAIATTKRLQTVTNIYVVSLAIADLLVAILVLPPAIVIFYNDNFPSFLADICEAWISCDIMLCTASIFSLCVISLDRFMAVTRPLHHTTRRSKRRALLMLAFAWILSLLVVIPPLFRFESIKHNVTICDFTDDQTYRVISATLSFFLPFVLIIFVYVRIFMVSYKRGVNFRNGSLASSTGGSLSCTPLDDNYTKFNASERSCTCTQSENCYHLFCGCFLERKKHSFQVVVDAGETRKESSNGVSHWPYKPGTANPKLYQFSRPRIASDSFVSELAHRSVLVESPCVSEQPIDDDTDLAKEDDLSSSVFSENDDDQLTKPPSRSSHPSVSCKLSPLLNDAQVRYHFLSSLAGSLPRTSNGY
ncbi:Histamine H1 receptor [Cichlidogyrus casuarinus]|uniref:Histamine H1 receptor n=1 Tax=Cichlidogyrus casuarinus TaxID=1844966 RepID=A0ABD2QAZ1_9PLAT